MVSKQRLMILSAEEFLRHFLLPYPAASFVRIRSFGFAAVRCCYLCPSTGLHKRLGWAVVRAAYRYDG